ncbi:putative transmembrane glycoprotein [Aspergillus candidus]|uniref:Transmembrane glyco protein n=1 Tax=Aspergillus candidus TaxID=41067 RepID=A0A2I2F1V9_ASPCN|nr:transmembrane glyco protein [Aspergillus candidus]PLB34620.1 transmembrane glyco protein [Aspergillus candidus]
MARIALVILGLLFLGVNARLDLSYPVNAQLPPVARVSKPFQFVFSQGTFGGSDSETTYALSKAPSWLHVNSKSRTLFGTPNKDDTGTVKFGLTASNGPVPSDVMEVTLIVTADDGPQPGKPLLPQLEKLGPTSAPSRFLLHSGDSFSISFDSDTFSNTRSSTVYYGTSPENAPLPSWVVFDEAALKFTGTTPNVGPQTFTFNLVASDVAGFSAATMTFEMTASPHVLAFNHSAQTFFVTRGKEFTSPEFIETLELDGHALAPADLSKLDVDLPDWLSLNKKTLSFHGTPPADSTDQNVTITVTDTYQNMATMIVSLQHSQFFHSDLKDCDAVIGEFFEFTFDQSVLTNDSVHVDVEMDHQKLPWLQYNSANKTLYGQAPSDLSPSKDAIRVIAREGTAEDSRELAINTVVEKTSRDEDSGSGIRGKKAGIIAISVVIPVAFVISVVLLLCCWRRRRTATTPEEGHLPDEKGGPLCDPDLPHSQPFEGTAQGQPPVVGRDSPSSKPPKLELGPLWNSDSFDDTAPLRYRPGKETTLSGPTIEWDFAPLRDPEPEDGKQADGTHTQPKRLSFQGSPPMRGRTNTSTRRREPLKSIQPRRSLKRNSVTSSKSKRHSRRSSGLSSVASGLPVRLSGAGHGAGGFGPPGHGVVRKSWQNTHDSLQSDENGVGNLAPLFPRPPPRAWGNLDYPARMSLRTVEPDNMTISESDSLEAFVHGRAKSRNASNPMFSGQVSRTNSSGIRALERARSNASHTDTLASSIYTDDHRRSVHDRPWSTAMSASIYTDDHRQSTYLQALSEESPVIRPLGPVPTEQSQSSLAQNYSKMIAPLPRFLSQLSLGSARPRDTLRGTDDPMNPFSRDSWYWDSSHVQRSTGEMGSQRMRKSPSDSSIPFDRRLSRASMMQLAGRDLSERRGMQRDLTGGSRGDIAFV